MKIPVIAADKANHVVYGALVSAAVNVTSALTLGLDSMYASAAGIGAAFIVGAWKELRDRKTIGATASGGDLVATLLGGVLPTLPQLAVPIIAQIAQTTA